jgi:SAM-dependent methyltransferase
MHRYAYGLVAEFARPDTRLLDVGFGEGYGSVLALPRVGTYVGVEVDHDAVAHASGTYADPRASFQHYDGVRLPFTEASFDLVTCFQVIEHVRDVEPFLREISRVTVPSGTVILVTPNRNHRLDDGEKPWNRYHVREFNPQELESIVRTVFPEVEIYGVHGSPAMDEIEKSRVARARKLARLDPFGLRYVLPESLDTRLRAAIKRRSHMLDESLLPEIGVEHVKRTQDDVAASLDLLAVASPA